MRRLSLALIAAPLLAPAAPTKAQETPAGPPRVAIRDVLVEVPGPVVIVNLVPEGSLVKKGDLLLDIDSSALRDNLVNQEIAAERARADLENAIKTRELATTEFKTVTELRHPEQVDLLRSRIDLARLELAQARTEREAAETDKRGDESVLSRARLAERRAEVSLQQAEMELRVLEDYTQPRRVEELRVALERAKAAELAEMATYQLEQSKMDRIRRWIERCKVLAPCDGVVVYASPMHPDGGRVEEGATVRERQRVLRIVPLQPEG